MKQEIIKRIFHYSPDTGLFTRLVKQGQRGAIGSIAGSADTKGYTIIKIDGKSHKAHRLAWLYVYGEMPDSHIDHINHNPSDNRISNLRSVTQAENNKNRPPQHDNKSGVSGVIWRKQSKKWMARISVKNKRVHLGLYSDINEAIKVRLIANVLYGFHKNHGISTHV